MMTIGLILLLIAGLLLLFGAGQRVLDKLRLTDRQALLAIALIIGGGFVPDIQVTPLFAFNLGGALIPLLLCLYLWARAGSGVERARCLAATAATAAAVFALGRFLPADPARMPFEVNYVYGLAAGAIGWLFGRSRRGAFIAGTLGVMLSSVASAAMVWREGVAQKLALGGAGGFDVIVISGLLAVLLSELIGEAVERVQRGRHRPTREFRGGDFIGKERT